jgi:hypothetical protein
MLNQMLKHKPMIAPIVFGIIDKPSSSQISKNNSYIALSVGVGGMGRPTGTGTGGSLGAKANPGPQPAPPPKRGPGAPVPGRRTRPAYRPNRDRRINFRAKARKGAPRAAKPVIQAAGNHLCPMACR